MRRLKPAEHTHTGFDSRFNLLRAELSVNVRKLEEPFPEILFISMPSHDGVASPSLTDQSGYVCRAAVAGFCVVFPLGTGCIVRQTRRTPGRA